MPTKEAKPSSSSISPKTVVCPEPPQRRAHAARAIAGTGRVSAAQGNCRRPENKASIVRMTRPPTARMRKGNSGRNDSPVSGGIISPREAASLSEAAVDGFIEQPPR